MMQQGGVSKATKTLNLSEEKGNIWILVEGDRWSNKSPAIGLPRIMGCCMMSLRGVQVGNSEWDVSRTDVPMLDEQMQCLFMTPFPTLGKNSVSKHHISQPLFSHKNHLDFSVG